MKDTALLILGAGSSSRMGEPKLLLDVNGSPLIQVLIKQLRSDQYDMYLVTGAYREEIQPCIVDLNCEEIYNPSWESGMGSSISTGIKKIVHKGGYSSVVIIAADQIMVKSNHINDIIKIWIRHPRCIVSAQYGKVRGIPALFPANFFENLIELSGDVGARKLISQNKERAIFYNLEEAHCDVDTVEEYKLFIKGIFHENN
ncbi:MAG: nucleotidyltransferase family protein [Saprospiraceae bacterium]|nr:nucleotidyltransferase family protein [Saprospiraceae bacterium]